MNIRALATLLFIPILGLPTCVLADAWSGQLAVESVVTYGNSDLILVYTTGGSEYVPGCSVDKWTVVADTEERRNRIYSTLLAAAAAGNQISIWYDTSGCGTYDYHTGYVVRFVVGS